METLKTGLKVLESGKIRRESGCPAARPECRLKTCFKRLAHAVTPTIIADEQINRHSAIRQ